MLGYSLFTATRAKVFPISLRPAFLPGAAFFFFSFFPSFLASTPASRRLYRGGSRYIIFPARTVCGINPLDTWLPKVLSLLPPWLSSRHGIVADPIITENEVAESEWIYPGAFFLSTGGAEGIDFNDRDRVTSR